jgi:hypothetical protein
MRDAKFLGQLVQLWMRSSWQSRRQTSTGTFTCTARRRKCHDTAGVIDEQSAGADESIARAQNSQISLRLRRAVVDGGEQLGIQSRQASEGFGVGSIILAGVVIDRS